MAVVVITGASSGLGAATARVLAREGHKLVLAARRADRLAALEQELGGACEVLTVPADLSDGAQVEALVRRAVERFGAIDVWVNNAGQGPRAPWWQSAPAEIEQVLDVNLTAPILAVRAVVPYMEAQGRGHIINVSSVSGHIGTNGIYSATKYGLRGFSEALRRELKPLGIQVSLISPGFIATEMTQGVKLRMPGPELVGRVVSKLIRRPRREVVVPGWYRVLIFFAVHVPGLADFALGLKVGR